MTKELAQRYVGASITDIRRGKGDRSKYIYAKIKAVDGEVLVTADLAYCVKRMEEVSKHF